MNSCQALRHSRMIAPYRWPPVGGELVQRPMRPRARMRARPDHGQLDALRLPARAGRAATRRGAPAGVLPDCRLRVGLAQAKTRGSSGSQPVKC
jgi:hypothetical protein